MAWSGSSGDIPHGWLSCDGAGFPNDRYPLLKDLLGYTYGGSDNAGTFNVPNLNNNRVPVHKEVHILLKVDLHQETLGCMLVGVFLVDRIKPFLSVQCR